MLQFILLNLRESIYVGSGKIGAFHLYLIGFDSFNDQVYLGSCKVGVFHLYRVGFESFDDSVYMGLCKVRVFHLLSCWILRAWMIQSIWVRVKFVSFICIVLGFTSWLIQFIWVRVKLVSFMYILLNPTSRMIQFIWVCAKLVSFICNLASCCVRMSLVDYVRCQWMMQSSRSYLMNPGAKQEIIPASSFNLNPDHLEPWKPVSSLNKSSQFVELDSAMMKPLLMDVHGKGKAHLRLLLSNWLIAFLVIYINFLCGWVQIRHQNLWFWALESPRSTRDKRKWWSFSSLGQRNSRKEGLICICSPNWWS